MPVLLLSLQMKRTDEPLDERAKAILRELILEYSMTGEPVGSRTLSKREKINLSPATIRNVLADLEEMGFIHQPHTSAGRVPTDKGYRFYVNYLLRSHSLNPSQKQLIHDQIASTAGSFEDLLVLTTQLLARLSHNIALAIKPDVQKMLIENIDFILINRTRVLAILVTRGGIVSNKVIELEEPIHQEDLTQIANYLRSEFAGMTLPAIRRKIIEMMKQERVQFDRLLQQAILLSQRTLENAADRDQVYIVGASQIIQHPEFANSGRTRDLLEALEQKSKIVHILTECIEGEGIHILIGSEHSDPDLKGLALISTAYKCDEERIGTLGILGPTRMEYQRVIPLVDHLAKVVSNVLSLKLAE